MNSEKILFAPSYVRKVMNGMHLLIDTELPNWIATDERGTRILGYVNGKRNFEEIVLKYSKDSKMDFTRAWIDCYNFLKDASRSGFVSTAPFKREPYPGRGKILKPEKLSELWLHVSNTCNLSCHHCLVDASPKAMKGISTEEWKRIIAEALELGVKRFYITGGEPLLRDDIFELLDAIVTGGADVVIMTNGTLLKGEVLKNIARFDPEKLKIQISLDGSTPEINDTIRGMGTFKSAIKGIKNVIKAGFKPSIATTVMRLNADDVPNITRLAAELGADYHHLLFAHKRGRSTTAADLSSPPTSKVIEAVRKAIEASSGTGVTVDNLEFAKYNISSKRGTKRDLSNIAYESLCVYCDGHVYPSASLAGYKPLDMGEASRGLRDVWLNSKIANDIRNASVADKKKCRKCYLMFICGGGDLEHAYLHSPDGSFLGHDPLCEMNKNLTKDAMYVLAKERSKMTNPNLGRPVVYYAMGEGALIEEGGDEPPGMDGQQHIVSTSRSNCVLFMELEESRRAVRRFYGEAAENPKEELCCAGTYNPEDISHIPKEVLEIAYGCGSPIGMAGISEGETVLDLGPGGGIDCFIAAKKVGKNGKVYGIDMTDEMLKKANENKPKVAENLGYDVVEFKKGYLEDVPVPDNSVDVVISNCVINLSPDKRQVFSEIFRILKNHGRVVISDTIASEEVPDHMQANPRLWGECVSGALTEEEYFDYLEKAGFYGISVLQRTFWKEIDGYKFYSAIIRGYKFDKDVRCKYVGQKAVYKGPFKATIDEDGNFFPRNEPVEISTDIAEKLKRPPYKGYFEVIEPGGGENAYHLNLITLDEPDEPGGREETPCCGPGEECAR